MSKLLENVDQIHGIYHGNPIAECALMLALRSLCVFPLFFAGDRPLIVQFAASNGKDLADAAELVCKYVTL